MKRAILLTVLIIILVAAGGYFYWNNSRGSVDAAMSKLGQLKTGTYVAHINIDNTAATKQLLGESGTINIALTGAFDRNAKPSNIQGTLDLAIKTTSVTMQLNGEMRMLGDKFFAIINNAPKSIPLFAQLKGQWIVLSRNATAPSSPEPSPKANLLSKVERVGREDVNGEKTIHFKAVATQDGVIAMTNAIANVIGSQLTTTQAAQIRDSLQKTGEVPVELWVVPGSNEMRRFSTAIPAPNTNTINFDLTLQNQNKPVNITAPQGAVTLQEAAQKAQQKTPVTPTP